MNSKLIIRVGVKTTDAGARASPTARPVDLIPTDSIEAINAGTGASLVEPTLDSSAANNGKQSSYPAHSLGVYTNATTSNHSHGKSLCFRFVDRMEDGMLVPFSAQEPCDDLRGHSGVDWLEDVHPCTDQEERAGTSLPAK